MSAKNKAIMAVTISAAILFLIWLKYSEFLSRGRRPPESSRILNQIEKAGVPDFSLKDISGNDRSLNEFRGKIVIINFWASWCEPCVTEFPSLQKLLSKYKDDIVLLAVSGDYEFEDILTFLKAFKVNESNIYVMWDKDSSVAKKFGTFRLPESYVVDRNGKLVRKITGVDDWASAEAFQFFSDLISGQ